MQRLIKEESNNPDFVLTQLEYDKLILVAKEKQIIVELIGNQFTELKDKTTKESNAKVDEFLTVTRFLYYSGLSEKYKVAELRESPDFILQVGDIRISVS